MKILFLGSVLTGRDTWDVRFYLFTKSRQDRKGILGPHMTRKEILV